MPYAAKRSLSRAPRITGSTHNARRNRAGGVTAQAARQGRFAAAFAADPQARANLAQRHHSHWAARRAWHRGLRAAFVPWYGPVFWPYAYSDIFDYAFWPYGYEDDYWAYAYDNFFDGVFWGEVRPARRIYARLCLCRSGRRVGAARKASRRRRAVHGARHRHHRLAVCRDRAQSRPQCRTEAVARRRP